MSKIEQIITEIEEYIDNCKFQPLSTSKIIVNKDDIDELLAELRLRTPEEIKKYQKIIANKDAIINDAKERSEAMISEATAHINQLVSEHEIMQQAYAQANETISKSNQQAPGKPGGKLFQFFDSAKAEANDLKTRAMQYTDDILSNVQSILSTGLQNFGAAQERLMTDMDDSLNVVVQSRKELAGQDQAPTYEEAPQEEATVDLDD